MSVPWLQATLELFKQRSSLFHWNPGARVFHIQFSKTVDHSGSEPNETRVNTLTGVSTKIEHDVLEAQAIRRDNQILWTVHGNVDTAVSFEEMLHTGFKISFNRSVGADMTSSLFAAARYMSSILMRNSSMKRRLELMVWPSFCNDTLNSSSDM
jgi:hypothetical protein